MNGKATISLTLGIESLILPIIGFFTAIAAIFYARDSKREILETEEKGAGLATAGMVCAIVALACTRGIKFSASVYWNYYWYHRNYTGQ